MQSKKNENIITTSNPDEMYAKYIHKPVLRKFTEQFMDADTAEVVEIDRNSVLFDRGTFIDNEILTQINFYMQTGDIKSVTVSDQKRVGFLIEAMRPILYTVTIEGGVKMKKSKILIHARTAKEAIDIAADYGELYYATGFKIKALKAFSDCIYIDSDQYQCTDDYITEEKREDMMYYMVDGNVIVNDKETCGYAFILLALDVETAKKTIHAYLAQNRSDSFGNSKWYFNVMGAGPTKIDHVVDPEFCMEYLEEKSTEGLIPNDDTV